MYIDGMQSVERAPRRLRRDAKANLDRVQVAAAAVFASQGLSATQADIARRAKVGVGTIYRRFPNKDDLIFEIYEPRLREGEALARKAAEYPNAWEGLAWFMEQSSYELASDRGFRQFILGGYNEVLGWSRSAPSLAMAELLAETDRRVGQTLTSLLERAKADGDLREDFEVTDVQVVAAAIQATVSFGGSHHPELYRRVIGLLLDGMRPSRQQPTALPVRALTEGELSRLTERPPGAGQTLNLTDAEPID
jgi:AcrR family transcriptional regulator